MLDVFLASPLVDGFYKNQIDDFRPAAGGGAAKILRKARWVGRKATSHRMTSESSNGFLQAALNLAYSPGRSGFISSGLFGLEQRY